MGNSGQIALTRANGFGPLPELLEARAGERALYRIFETEGLPIGLIERPHMPVPLSAMVGVFARSALQLGDRAFGLEIGERMTHRGYGLWVEYGSSASSLGAALRRLETTIWAHQTGASMEFLVERERPLWRYVPARRFADNRQHADHILPPMLEFARAYLGRHWRPDWVEVNYARDPTRA